jgi:hypothetical protein
MKFKCAGSDTAYVDNRARATIKGEFDTLAHKVFQTIPHDAWYAQCSLCGREWGPFNDLDDLEEAMVRDGVLK